MLKFNSVNQLLSSMPANIYWLDIQNIYQGCNLAQALDFKLSSAEEIFGKRNVDLPIFKDHPEIAHEIDEINLEVMRSNTPKILEEKSIKNGECKIYLSYKSPLIDSDNNVLGLLGVSIDITDLKLIGIEIHS